MAKKQLKALLPSLRESKRYLAFELISKTKIDDFKAVKDEIKQSATSLFGEIGMAKVNMKFVKDNVIMVNHKFVDHMRAALAVVKTIKGVPVILRSVKVSGMINKV